MRPSVRIYGNRVGVVLVAAADAGRVDEAAGRIDLTTNASKCHPLRFESSRKIVRVRVAGHIAHCRHRQQPRPDRCRNPHRRSVA